MLMIIIIAIVVVGVIVYLRVRNRYTILKNLPSPLEGEGRDGGTFKRRLSEYHDIRNKKTDFLVS